MTPATFTIRPATSTDLDAILALDRATLTAPHWPRETYLQILFALDSPDILNQGEIQDAVLREHRLRPQLASPVGAIDMRVNAEENPSNRSTSSYPSLLTTSSLPPVNFDTINTSLVTGGGGGTANARTILVADTPHTSGQVLGFAAAAFPPALAEAELESIVVAANHRRSGIGRALCSVVIDWARSLAAAQIHLEVRAANAPALALYSSLGFSQTARRTRYYADPEDDAILMTLSLRSNASQPEIASRKPFPPPPAS